MRNLHPALVHGLLATAVLAGPGAASAQDAVASPPGGWIGIVTDTARLYVGYSTDPTLAIRVTAVHVSGPAELGGVQPGDILLAWNGRALDSRSYPDWLSAVTDLDPGQPIVLGLMRDGEEREVTVIASELPAGEYDLRLDMTGFDSLPSMLEFIQDFVESRQGTLEITTTTSSEDSAGWDSASLTITVDDSSMSAGYQRFEVSPGAGIRTERIQGITVTGISGAEPPGSAGVAPDRLAAGLRVDSMQLDSVGAEPPLRRGAGMTEEEVVRLTEDIDRAFTRASEAGAFPVPPPLLDPFDLGSVVLGGARVRTLSSALGRYFGIEQGVLILEVVTMSPARSAGFRPGDVVVAVAGSEVATLSQLRFQLSVAELPVQVAVVRKGERIELTYPVR